MSAILTLGLPKSGPTNNGFNVPERSDIPRMRARTGRRGTDREMAKLLCEALENIADTPCSFWACKGPNRPQHMVTCRKCWSMRTIATVLATLEAREPGRTALAREEADRG